MSSRLAIPDDLPIRRDEPLAKRTTLELGGSAELFLEAPDRATVVRALAWASGHGVPVSILGGGSNTIVPDEGVAGLVLVPSLRGVSLEDAGDAVRVRAAAGESWDALVARCVDEGLAGLEGLSGIPGLVGATPIQNVGAYGQEVSETIVEVAAIDRRRGETVRFAGSECGFAYRDSRFKHEPERFVVVEVVFALERRPTARARYAELARVLPGEAPLATVRETVIRLRRAKSMVLDPSDPNGRSAGSFFTNPIVDDATAERVVDAALASGIVSAATEVPRWPSGPGRTKLAAGWLIEKAGIAKGLRRGPVGVSSVHALALVHHGGGTTRELLALADEVKATVRARFGVELEREPVILGGR